MPRRKFDVRRHCPVELPNGRTVRITFINHPGAVLIVPFLNKDLIVMMRQFRPALKKYIYELPAGTLEADEPPSACARRELLEETGFKAGRLVKLGAIYPVPGYSTEVIHIFKAGRLTAAGAQPEDYEVIELIPMNKSTVRRLLVKGKLMDAKSICALVFCGWL